MIPTDIKQKLIDETNKSIEDSVNEEWKHLQETAVSLLKRAAKQGETFKDISVTHKTNQDKLVKMFTDVGLTAIVIGTSGKKVRVTWIQK